jgi:tetratricopeptide (TPR) repeat protein
MAQKEYQITTTSSCKHVSTIPEPQCDQTKRLSTSDIAHTTNDLSGHFRFRIIENFIVVWLDSDIKESNDDTKNFINRLRCMINSIKTFADPDQCVEFLTKVENEKVFLIVSESLGQQVVPLISELAQVASIYVLCDDNSKHEHWFQECKKVKGVFTQIETLCDALKRSIRRSENDLIPISIVSSHSTINLNELDQSFMYSQLLKEILLEREYDAKEKEQFIDFCRLYYSDNVGELEVINEFEQKYPAPSSIWWYTRDCFIYTILNKALRILDVQIILKMGFLVRNLHVQINQLHSEMNYRYPLTVYRGQGVLNSEFEKMKRSKGGLLSFNNFLSTSIDRAVSYLYADSSSQNPDLMGILFQIEVDPSVSIAPFAFLDKISYFGDQEKEVLFSMHTVFRISDMMQIENRVWQVNLTLTSDNDQELTLLTEHIRKATQGPTGIHRIAQLMYYIGAFEKAEEIFTALLETTSDDDRQLLGDIHHQLGYINDKKGNLMNALSHFRQSLDVYFTYLPSNDARLSPTYNAIGMVLAKQGHLENALEYLERALNIDIHVPESDQVTIATRHSNIGLLLKDQGKPVEALQRFERAIEIFLVHLPPRHPSLATIYNNIGLVHRSMGDNSSALSYYETTLEIRQKSLPANHPLLAEIHSNMALVLDDLHRTREAIEHAEQAVEIGCRSLGPDHRHVQAFRILLDHFRRKL